MTPEMMAILAVGVSLAGVSVALGGLVWQSHRALRADLGADLRDAKEDRDRLRAELGAGLRDAKEDRDRLRAELGGRMDRMEGRMRDQSERLAGIEGVLRDQGERVSRIEGMLHLHFGRNEDPDPPPAPAE